MKQKDGGLPYRILLQNGRYHIRGNQFETSGVYALRGEIVAIGNEQPEEKIVDEFRMQMTTSTAPQQPQ